MILKDLNKLAEEAQKKSNSYDNREFILSDEFKKKFKELLPNYSIDFQEFTSVVKTNKNLTIFVPNQWFILASFFYEYLNALKSYKAIVEKLKIDKYEIQSLKNENISESVEIKVSNYFTEEEDILKFKRFICNYEWWHGSKTIDRADYYVSPILNLAGVVNVTQGYIADLAYVLSDHFVLIELLGNNYFKSENLQQETIELRNNLVNIDGSEIIEEVEIETGNDEVSIDIPFDPDKIKVNIQPYSIGMLVEDIGYGRIKLDTEFQRKAGLWNPKQKSRFIESLILNLPIPSFYLSEYEDNTLEVIDGLQRISTIIDFIIDNNLVLSDLEFLNEFKNKKFNELPLTLQVRIKRTKLNVYIIEKGTPIEVKYNIFSRVNTGGLVLTPQEIRHAINQGIPAELLADLVRSSPSKNKDGFIIKRKNFDKTEVELLATEEGKAFAKATGGRINASRMEDRDFANRFLAFYLINYTEYKPDLNTFLNSGLKVAKSLNANQIKDIKNDFREAMNLAFNIFGNDAFRKRFKKTDKRKPINKALFEVLSVNFAKLNSIERDLLLNKKTYFENKLIELHNKPDGNFLRSITQGTAQKDLVNQRFSDIEKIIKETLND